MRLTGSGGRTEGIHEEEGREMKKAVLLLGFMFVLMGCDASGSDEGTADTGYVGGPDVVAVEDVGTTVGTDTGGTQEEDTYVNPCEDGLVLLTIDDEDECVPEALGAFITHIGDGLLFERVEPDDGMERYLKVTHINTQPEFYAGCPEGTRYLLLGAGPLLEHCLHDDLSLSLCADDASLCGGRQVTDGQVSFDEEAGKYVVTYLKTLNGENPQTFTYMEK